MKRAELPFSMLPKNQRLASYRVEHLLRKGKKSGNVFFTLKYLPNPKSYSRFCVIVSSKVLPKAVERNKLRRQIYEIFRNSPELPGSATDIIFIAKTPLTKLKFQELTKTILQSLQNLTPIS